VQGAKIFIILYFADKLKAQASHTSLYFSKRVEESNQDDTLSVIQAKDQELKRMQEMLQRMQAQMKAQSGSPASTKSAHNV